MRPAIPSWSPRITGRRFRTAWTCENPRLHHCWRRRVFLFRTGSRRSSSTCCRPKSLHWAFDPLASWPRPHGIHAYRSVGCCESFTDTQRSRGAGKARVVMFRTFSAIPRQPGHDAALHRVCADCYRLRSGSGTARPERRWHGLEKDLLPIGPSCRPDLVIRFKARNPPDVVFQSGQR